MTQSLTNVSGVDPVTSSHCARVVPPAGEKGEILKIDTVSQFGKVSAEGYGERERERIKRKKHFDQGTAGDFSK